MAPSYETGRMGRQSYLFVMKATQVASQTEMSREREKNMFFVGVWS